MANEKNPPEKKSTPKKVAAKKSPAKKAAAPKKTVAPKIASSTPVEAEQVAGSAPVAAPAEKILTAKPAPSVLYEEIRRRAYELYHERGGHHGSHEADWHRAEAEVREKYKS
jgi:hypothetical protein